MLAIIAQQSSSLKIIIIIIFVVDILLLLLFILLLLLIIFFTVLLSHWVRRVCHDPGGEEVQALPATQQSAHYEAMAQYASNGVQYRRAPSSSNRELVTNQAPPSIFKRSMDWRNKRDNKIKRLRQQAQLEGGGVASMNFNDQYKDATVGEHLDAYHRYNMIVGEADGGNPLPEAQYRKLEKRCLEAAKDRLFCTWRNSQTGMDCVNVGPMTRCFCGHSYRAHAFYRNQSKKVHCRVPNCKCNLFNYVYHRGGRAVKCQCKHDLEEHRDNSGRPIPCSHGGGRCMCKCFVPTVTCTCEQPASLHRTVFERRSERETDGRVTRALWEEMEKTGGGGGMALEGGDQPQTATVEAGRDLARANMAMAAGAGGLTSYLSLAPGTERVLVQPTSALPLTKLTSGEYNHNSTHSTGLTDDPANVRHSNTAFQLPLHEVQQYGQDAGESLSPLSKHVVEHDEQLRLLKERKRQPKSKQYPQNSSQHVASSYQSRHAQRKNVPPQPGHSSSRNAKGTYLKRGSGAKASPRLARTQQHNKNTRNNQRKHAGSTIVNGNKPLPSYMRSTAATRLWKSSTEAEKKKPKHMRTEIY